MKPRAGKQDVELARNSRRRDLRPPFVLCNLHPRPATKGIAAQGRFKEAHALLFSTPDSSGTRPWSSFAARIDVPEPAAFEACLRDSLPAAIVQKDEADAQRLGLRVTPTFLMDDQLIHGARTVANMDAMIRKRLAK